MARALPALVRVAAHNLEEYEQEYSGWETTLFDFAHSEGLAAPMVNMLREDAIGLAARVAERGTPLSDQELVAYFNYNKIPAALRPGLTKMWRALEGGPAA